MKLFKRRRRKKKKKTFSTFFFIKNNKSLNYLIKFVIDKILEK